MGAALDYRRPELQAQYPGLAALAKMSTHQVAGGPLMVRTLAVFGQPPVPLHLPLNGKTTENTRVELALDKLEPRQTEVPVRGLQSYIVQTRRDPPDVAHITFRNGRERYVIQEGHTRLGAALLRGETSRDVRLWEFIEDAAGQIVPVPRGLHKRGIGYRDKLTSLAMPPQPGDPDWEEEEHKRDRGGQFAPKTGGATAAVAKAPVAQVVTPKAAPPASAPRPAPEKDWTQVPVVPGARPMMQGTIPGYLLPTGGWVPANHPLAHVGGAQAIQESRAATAQAQAQAATAKAPPAKADLLTQREALNAELTRADQAFSKVWRAKGDGPEADAAAKEFDRVRDALEAVEQQIVDQQIAEAQPTPQAQSVDDLTRVRDTIAQRRLEALESGVADDTMGPDTPQGRLFQQYEAALREAERRLAAAQGLSTTYRDKLTALSNPTGVNQWGGPEDWGKALTPGEARATKDVRFGEGAHLHGTSLAHLKGILSGGISPQPDRVNFKELTKPGHVYATTNFDNARYYASIAASTAEGDREGSARPVVLELRVPEAELASFTKDEHDNGKDKYVKGAVQRKGSIPPEWIVGVHVSAKGPEVRTYSHKEKDRRTGSLRSVYVMRPSVTWHRADVAELKKHLRSGGYTTIYVPWVVPSEKDPPVESDGTRPTPASLYRDKLAFLLGDRSKYPGGLYPNEQEKAEAAGKSEAETPAASSGGEKSAGYHPSLTDVQREMQETLRQQAQKPVRVVATPEEGVALILKGENVELQDTKHVHTVLEKLAAIAIDAKAKGEDAPNFDPCSVTVAGSSLFCTEKIKTAEFPHGIPRIEMPQFKSKTPIPGSEAAKLTRDADGEIDATKIFMDHLRASGVPTEETTMPAAKLKASQAEMEGAKVAGMMVSTTRDPRDAQIIVSRDGYVVDGHHTWAATVGRDAEDGNLHNDKPMKVVKIDLPMSQIYRTSVDWTRKFGVPQAGVKKNPKLSYRAYLALLLGDRSKYPGGLYPNEQETATGGEKPASGPGAFTPPPVPPLAADAAEYPRLKSMNTFTAASRYAEGETLNAGLRAGALGSAVEQQQVEVMDAAMRPLPEAMTVHRVVNAKVMESLTPGTVFHDNGFTSTTAQAAAVPGLRSSWKTKGEKLGQMEIRLPKEQPHVRVNEHVQNHPYGRWGSQVDEVVLPRGSRFRVLERTETRSGPKLVMEMVHD